jgi:hypothetical protein
MQLQKGDLKMKHFSFLFMFLIILFSGPIYSQYYEDICPLPTTINLRAVVSQTGGQYKPANNLPGQYLRVLVVFVQFQGDSRPNSNWNPNQLPNWANDFIDSQTASEYTDMTISDFWKEMSMGNFDFIGDVYPELVTLPPESYYYLNNKNFVSTLFTFLSVRKVIKEACSAKELLKNYFIPIR